MNLLAHRGGRTVVFAALYFSEGCPIGLIWWAMPTLLRLEGVPVARITELTAVLVLPWAFKFLWAPLVDSWRRPGWGFRAWIISAQLAMGFTLMPLIWLDVDTHLGWWRALLLAHAFAAATQDVAIDALAINAVPAGERGALNGAMQTGMLFGRSVFGGGAVFAATWLTRGWILAALIACTWLTLALVLFVNEPASHGPTRARSEFSRDARAALSRRSTWFGLAFALTSAAAFEAVGQLAGPFLVDRGVSQQTIGVFFGIAVVAAMVAGALIGGRLSDRWGRTRSVALFLAGFVACIALLGALDVATASPPTAVLLGLLAAMYFFIGLFTAASYALFMELTDPRLGGTQFSAFMSATNGCEAWSAWAGGQLVARVGYGASFLVMCAASVLSVPLLRELQPKVKGR